MKIKHWLYALAVTFLLSTGMWAESYPAPTSGKVVYASYRGDHWQNRNQHRRHHHRHHHHRQFR